MTAINDITGDRLSTKFATKKYRDNYDLIFNKPKTTVKESPLWVAGANYVSEEEKNAEENSLL